MLPLLVWLYKQIKLPYHRTRPRKERYPQVKNTKLKWKYNQIGVYAASRMLFALTKNGDAPRALTKLSKNGVPVRAVP
jgi:hypothetical protein